MPLMLGVRLDRVDHQVEIGLHPMIPFALLISFAVRAREELGQSPRQRPFTKCPSARPERR